MGPGDGAACWLEFGWSASGAKLTEVVGPIGESERPSGVLPVRPFTTTAVSIAPVMRVGCFWPDPEVRPPARRVRLLR